MKKIEVSVSMNKEAKEKVNNVMKEVAYTSMSVVGGALVGGVIGATVQKVGHYSKPANVAGNLVGLGVTWATAFTMYERLKVSDAIQQKQLELLTVDMVEDEILDDEEGGETEEA